MAGQQNSNANSRLTEADFFGSSEGRNLLRLFLVSNFVFMSPVVDDGVKYLNILM